VSHAWSEVDLLSDDLSPHKNVSVSKKTQKWEVDETKVKHPPTDFPMARTSHLFPGAKANVIAKRIAACLQKRSIKAEFSKSEPLAKCSNLNFVQFHVRLFGDKGGTVVEVHRICGDCNYMSFMHDYCAILNACGGEELTSATSMQPTIKQMMTRIPPLENLEPLSSCMDAAAGSLRLVANLLSLSKDRIDANMIGMEKLAFLSNATKTFKATSLLCAKMILRSEEDFNLDIHTRLMSIIVYGCETDANPSGGDETTLRDFDERLRNLALCSTSNALGLLIEDGCLYEIIKSNQDWFLEVLIPRLVEDVAMAHDRPHNACYASRCLSCLASSSRVFALKTKEEGVLLALESAEQVGKDEFALLALDAHRCRNKILECV